MNVCKHSLPLCSWAIDNLHNVHWHRNMLLQISLPAQHVMLLFQVSQIEGLLRVLQQREAGGLLTAGPAAAALTGAQASSSRSSSGRSTHDTPPHPQAAAPGTTQQQQQQQHNHGQRPSSSGSHSLKVRALASEEGCRLTSAGACTQCTRTSSLPAAGPGSCKKTQVAAVANPWHMLCVGHTFDLILPGDSMHHTSPALQGSLC